MQIWWNCWNAKGIRKKTTHLQSMTYVRPSNVSNVIGTELASAAVSGTGSNAPEELSKLERDWARIVGRKTELSDRVACPPITSIRRFRETSHLPVLVF